MLVKIRKIGNSLVITLPKELVKSKKIKEEQLLKVIIKKVRKNRFGILEGMERFTAKDELKSHA